MSIVTLSLILFLIMDPVGHIKRFLAALQHVPAARQKPVIFREMLIALAATLIFNFIGEYIFQLLGISDITVYLASGLILFLVAIKILFGRNDNGFMDEPKEEPFLVPLAIPLIAGPALLATVMLYAQSEDAEWPLLISILISWSASCLILLNSKKLLHLLGPSGLTACEKLMGMVLVLLAVQRFLGGVQLLLKAGAAS